MRPKNEFVAVLLLCVAAVGIRMTDNLQNADGRLSEQNAVYAMAPIGEQTTKTDTVTLRDWAEKRYFSRKSLCGI